MCDKTTLAYNDDFHFYQAKIGDDLYVCLKIWGLTEAGDNNEVTVVIPLAIWEEIRSCGAQNLTTDEQKEVLSAVNAIKKETMFIT